MSTALVLGAVIAIALSGVPGLFLRRGDPRAQRLATILNVVGSALGVSALVASFLAPGRDVVAAWGLPDAEMSVSIDGLSAAFLFPLFVVSALGAIYGEGYWAERDHPQNGRKLRLFWGLMTAGIALVFMAKNGLVFLFGWEVMALSAFVLIITDDEDERTADAGLIYAIATHTATLALFGVIALLKLAAGSYALRVLPAGVANAPMGKAIFLLAVFSFGTKAGLMPLHIWLPPAHAASPSHVSALMSGVLIKTGIYGLARIVTLFPDPPLWWGELVLVMGVVSGVLGVAFALGQHDIKRLLAYHSVENIGIIAIGLGVALMGRSLGKPTWIALGLAGALLHVVNHAIFKSLLFFGAGSVIHATGTREMDRLGGLAKLMPRTSLAFLIGAVAISGLPPLNGFVSEWLIYLGLFGAATGGETAARLLTALALPALALIGALALACFVKAFGAIFLGTPRSPDARAAHEAAPSMTFTMAAGAALCAIIGVAPIAMTPLLDAAVTAASPETHASPVGRLAPFASLTLFACVLAAALVSIALLLRRRLLSAPRTGTWDCGYAAPSPRMQYTSSSFADWSVGFFRWALFPVSHSSGRLALFPPSASYTTHVPDTVLDRALIPGFRAVAWLVGFARYLQRGRLQLYLLYVAATLLFLLWRA